MIQGLNDCTPEIRGTYLRAIMSSFAILHQKTDEIFSECGESMLKWLDDKQTGMTAEEDLRIFAAVMRIQRMTMWFDQANDGKSLCVVHLLILERWTCHRKCSIITWIITGHKRLLWTFCCDGNIEMAKFMLSLSGIRDFVMEDGTTAFSMALARRDLHLIRLLLASYHPSDIDQSYLAKAAVKELDKLQDKTLLLLRMELDKGASKTEGSLELLATESTSLPECICQE